MPVLLYKLVSYFCNVIFVGEKKGIVHRIILTINLLSLCHSDPCAGCHPDVMWFVEHRNLV